LLLDYNTTDAETCITEYVQLTQHTNTNATIVRTQSQDSFLPGTIIDGNGNGLGGRALTVRTNAFVKRVIFESGVAVGVE
jgi:hypothetical protein